MRERDIWRSEAYLSWKLPLDWAQLKTFRLGRSIPQAHVLQGTRAGVVTLWSTTRRLFDGLDRVHAR